MIELSKKRVYLALESGKLPLDLAQISTIDNSSIDGKLTQLLHENQIEIERANSENLDSLETETADVYLSNLCLHLVENPQNMINEAYRVLKKGGNASFSVFGDKQNSLYFSLFDTFIEQQNKLNKEPTKNFRSKFYLSDRN